jgi:diguanylate cyclase (GGDEF)-like protein
MLDTAHVDLQTSSPALLRSWAAGASNSSISLRRLWWAAILLLGSATGAVGWTVWQLRNDAIRDAISDSGNMAAVLANQLARSLRSIDGALLDIRKSAAELDIREPSQIRAVFNREEMRQSLRQHLAQLPHIFNMVVADEHGQLVVSTAAWPTPNINVADRDYFISARTRAGDQLSASVPIVNRIDGTQTIVFARRLETSKGAFAGVVFASVNFKYFQAIYESTESIRSMVFTLVRPDGTILYRNPDTGGFGGSRLSADSTFQEAVAKGTDGYRILARVDGNFRYVSVRPVPGFPLFVNISITENMALAGWLQRSAAIAIGSAIFLLCSIYLLIAFTRQLRCLSASEAALMQKSQQLDAALNNMSQGLSMFDEHQRLVVCNKQYAAMYNLAADQLKPGSSLRAILEARAAIGIYPSEDYIVDRIDRLSLGTSFCTVDNLNDGRVVSITHQRMENGGWVAIHQDITSQKRIEAELARMARYDALTDLANRTLFLENVNQALARMRQSGECFAVLMVDLDGFKAVNDSLGHAIGDSLLKAMADRLRKLVRDVECVARLGGDEFAIIQAGGQDHRDRAIVLANRILSEIIEPYDLDGRKVVIGTSIGITLAPEDAGDVDALIRNADLALYKAKSEGRNRYRFFEPSMEMAARERRELEEDMQRAMSRDEFVIHYQTIIDLEKRVCHGAEALVRWQHPKRGLILPEQFIGLAEESGLIVPLGAWILRRACVDAAKWPSHLKVAVNLSPVQFKQSDLLETLKSALEQSGLDPSRLELEITETILIDKNEKDLAVLHDLKSLGISIVLDDFGIGYSSMRYLQMFPFDKIKVDKSFIQNMTSHSDSAAIVGAIIGLGRNLDITTTAEGVETADQLTLLRAAGCQLAQGFLFSRPAPVSQLSFERSQSFPKGAEAA